TTARSSAPCSGRSRRTRRRWPRSARSWPASTTSSCRRARPTARPRRSRAQDTGHTSEEPNTMPETTSTPVNLKTLLSRVRLSPDTLSTSKPMVQSNLETITTDVTAEERFISSMAAVVFNLNQEEKRFDKQSIQGLINDIDQLVESQINEI